MGVVHSEMLPFLLPFHFFVKIKANSFGMLRSKYKAYTRIKTQLR